MSQTQQTAETASRCTLCPAGCELQLAWAGPDMWRSEVGPRSRHSATGDPSTQGGLCPRGSALGELTGHPRRIVSPTRRLNGRTNRLEMAAAVQAILEATTDCGLMILMDGQLPCEQLIAAAAWCRAWPQARLCFAIEPADEQVLLGAEAAACEYLAAADLPECDGFLIVGDVFSANPMCSRGVFDRRHGSPRTPIVVIDPACSKTVKFATHAIATPPGGELSALSAVAAAGNVPLDFAAALVPGAAEAGEALAGCKRLGVLISAEYGRGDQWRQIGYTCGLIAKARGGGLAVQTVGANALAALRIGAKMETVSLSEALSPDAPARIAIGCDVAGMLGWRDVKFLAAAAPLPNLTTDAAEIILPVALPAETAGTYMLDGQKRVEVPPLASAPAGVPQAAEIVATLARAAGVTEPDCPKLARMLERVPAAAPDFGQVASTAPRSESQDAMAPALLLGRQAAHDGCGCLTRHASWQANAAPLPVLRACVEDAKRLKAVNLSTVTVRVERSVSARMIRSTFFPSAIRPR